MINNSIYEQFSKWTIRLIATCFLGVIIYILQTYLYQGLKPYVIGDLLINYSCGFSRRGLVGTLILMVSELFEVKLDLVVSSIIYSSYFLFLCLIVVQFWKKPLMLLFVIAAPFGLLMLANDWSSFGRKEIFSYLIFQAAIATAEKIKHKCIRITILGVFVILGTLIHESFLLLSLPWICLAILLLNPVKNAHRHISKFGMSNQILILYGIGAMLLLLLVQSVPSQEKQHCIMKTHIDNISKIENIHHGIEFNAAIAPVQWLSKDISYGIDYSKTNYSEVKNRRYWFPRLILFILLVCLASTFFDWNVFAFKKYLLIHCGIIISFFCVQLIIAYDWGRFLQISFINFSIFTGLLPYKRISSKLINRISMDLFSTISIILSSFIMIPVYFDGVVRTFFMQSFAHKFGNFFGL